MRTILAALGVVSILSVSQILTAAAPDLKLLVGSPDWPTCRGANRTGVSDDKGLLQEWTAGEPPFVWEARGAGRAYATVARPWIFCCLFQDPPTLWRAWLQPQFQGLTRH